MENRSCRVNKHGARVRTHVNKMEAMYGRSRLTVKVEPRSSLNFYVYARKIYVRKYVKLPDCGNPPQPTRAIKQIYY